MPRPRRRTQAGFTLLELLVTIAILGIISGVASLGVARFRANAQQVALDQSLRSLATAVEATMILEDITDLRQIDPATIDLRNTDGIDFTSVDPTADSVIVQARFTGSDEPCRQMKFPSRAMADCEPLDGRTAFPFTPGVSTDPLALAARNRVESDCSELSGGRPNMNAAADCQNPLDSASGDCKAKAPERPSRIQDTDMVQELQDRDSDGSSSSASVRRAAEASGADSASATRAGDDAAGLRRNEASVEGNESDGGSLRINRASDNCATENSTGGDRLPGQKLGQANDPKSDRASDNDTGD